MAERRDNKGRILKDGEYQKSYGRYEYRYTDLNGEKHSVYSWRLTASDKTPVGKKVEPPLRELEKAIRKDLDDCINTHTATKLTLSTLFERNMKSRVLKQSTKTNYTYMYNKYVRNEIGNQKVSLIRYTDIKAFYRSLIDKGFKLNSLEVINTILHPIFQDAVRNGYIRTNPTDGIMAEIKKRNDFDSPKRHSLTEEQQSSFIDFIKDSKTYRHWLPLFTVFLGTGCRVGEIIGLRWDDVDFAENLISINHSLIYRLQDDGTCEFHITTPKTKKGIREIPMFKEVKEALYELKLNQKQKGACKSVIDGYSNFIFSNRFGLALSPHAINRAIERIVKAYNKVEMERSEKEKRTPVLLPHFSAHHLRHTFCTRFCEHETNLKVIQEIMGHADIETTMNVYNEATLKAKRKSIADLEGKFKIG